MTTPPEPDLFPARTLRASLWPAAAIGIFPVAGIAVALAAPEVALLRHRSPTGLAANHLVTLGWATAVAIGVLTQLLPAAAGVRREAGGRPARHLALHLTGLAMMVGGVLYGAHGATAVGGLIVTGGILVFVVDAAAVLRRRTRTLPVLPYVAGALICLVATVIWGVVLAENRRHLFSPALLARGLSVHVALGLIGWFGLLIVGMSYYLVPRFAGVRDAERMHATGVGVGLVVGLALAVAGAAASSVVARIGLLVLGGTGLVYAGDLIRLLRAWSARPRDLTRAHWIVMVAETLALSVTSVMWSLGLLPGTGVRWGVAAGVLFLLGWVTLAITGQAVKVTPFLMWYYRYHRGLTAYEIPRLEAPYWPRGSGAILAVLAVSAPLLSAGVLLARPLLASAGGVLFALGAWGIAALLAYSWLPAVWRGRRPPPPAEAG
jgi:hypothetical protein